ncbi:acyl-CoA dehydrogenase [Panacagrimonas perspica]|uniref:Acyl-[acyl-carrier-protein] dehydrogenase MbtN n=1 Tax=Panacagrimonas perspica TaxID=381431 RepID=A0A4S3K3B9_9GAMM|nr:acyl-CoA dehydrogenase family protein [Panacagrimonas perspica]TDU28968.1 acyl-CoA dehydrogenase [Panacagrimonas perspica]THD02214.1 acyl-CoA dehydrogenase [Panacagrimonas perspica]
MTATPFRSSWMNEELDLLRDSVRRFFEAEAVPNDHRWNQQKHVDREFWRKAGEVGILCAGIPAEYGGAGGTFAHEAVIFEEQGRAACTSFGNHVHSGISAHYVNAYGSEAQKRRYLPKLASGEMVAAIAMTEPGAGSDLQNIKTRAVRDGDHYVISGAKTFISNGSQADLLVLAVKTNLDAGGRGISMLLVETADLPGFRRGKILDKVGMHGQDTSELFFDEARVPVEALLGVAEGQGFAQMMQQLPRERVIIALQALATAERAVELTHQYTHERKAFGKHIADFQNTRFSLAECHTEARIGRVFIDHCIEKLLVAELDTATASMAKYWITDKQCEIVDTCLQFFGGYGYIAEYPIARMFADARVQKIYGGANEIMKEVIARSM